VENVAVYRCESCDELVMVSDSASEKTCYGDGLERVNEGDVDIVEALGGKIWREV
jgi:hypothetical protein